MRTIRKPRLKVEKRPLMFLPAVHLGMVQCSDPMVAGKCRSNLENMRFRMAQFALSFLFLLGLRLATPPSASAQDTPTNQAPEQSGSAPAGDSSADGPTT